MSFSATVRGQRWKVLGLACVGGLTGYLVLNASGMNPAQDVQASKPALVARAAAVQQADPSPFPAGKPQTRGIPVRIQKPPAPPTP